MKDGIIRRGVQLQGWTIENWLKSPEPIKSLAKETLDNLKHAYQKGYIEIGASGYTHPILPLLTEDLVYAQIELDIEVLKEYIGEPTWFWFPEGVVDQKALKVLFEKSPKLIAVIPDTALERKNFSGFVRIKHKNGKEQKAIICNSLLKDIMLNAEYYPQKPSYVLKSLNWSIAQKMVYNGEKFFEVLQTLGGNSHVLVRDWENKGSKDGLVSINAKGLDIKGLVELGAEFKLPSEVGWSKARLININEMKPGSWEVDAPEDDPFLYWWPNERSERWQNLDSERKNWVLKWESLIKDYNKKFSMVAEKAGGIEKSLENKIVKEKIKGSLPALMSCIPWHFLAKPEWKPDPGFSELAWKNIVVPAKEQFWQSNKR